MKQWLLFVGVQHLAFETMKAIVRTNQQAHARMVTSLQAAASQEMDRYVAQWGTEGKVNDGERDDAGADRR
jgi:hypothetical protein